jgi:epoxyqueuosine reductase
MNQALSGNREQTIKTALANLGFVLNGITTPEPIEGFSHYQHWIEVGNHADMRYLARPDTLEKRANPAMMLPGAKSIIVVGIPYTPFRQKNLPPAVKTIASYAQGPDYHRLIPEKLASFVVWLGEYLQQDIHHAIFTDSAPILEQELAIRAGIGWRGKNTLIVNPTYGSSFLLAEIFVDVALTLDEPFLTDLCGNCHQCIDACPTGCILDNRTIDARRCRSYLTIEKRGEFSREESQWIGDSIFGCDICQLVCPWNQRSVASTMPRLFDPQPSLQSIKHEDLLALDHQAFKQRFGDTPIARAKRNGLIRNLITAMGNQADMSDLSLLSQFIERETDPALVALAQSIHNELSREFL